MDDDCAALTRYAIESRDPDDDVVGPDSLVGEAEGRAAAAAAHRIIAAIKAQL